MPGRKSLPHETPSWIDPAAEIFFITICTEERGGDQLTKLITSRPLLESVAYRYQCHHWYPHIFLLMPDHCHALISFPAEKSPTKVLRDWKHWTATQHDVSWQRDFFEHRLRREESLSEKWEYISQNPVRAGLVEKAEDWPHVWRADW